MQTEPIIEAPPALHDLPGFHEPFSAISHLAGAAIFLVLGVALLMRGRRHPPGLPYLAVYAASVVLLLSMSGVYHMMVRGGAAHAVMERLDHGAIFVLIAGSFTPIHGILFDGWRRWAPLAFIWTAAILGIVLKVVFLRDFAEWVGLALYLGMGWVGIFGGVLLERRYGFRFIQLLLMGGIAYSIGAIIEFLQWFTLLPGVVHPHEVFHLFVLLGIAAHWLFIWQFADGRAAGERLKKSGVRTDTELE
jgi:hemolysin III